MNIIRENNYITSNNDAYTAVGVIQNVVIEILQKTGNVNDVYVEFKKPLWAHVMTRQNGVSILNDIMSRVIVEKAA